MKVNRLERIGTVDRAANRLKHLGSGANLGPCFYVHSPPLAGYLQKTSDIIDRFLVLSNPEMDAFHNAVSPSFTAFSGSAAPSSCDSQSGTTLIRRCAATSCSMNSVVSAVR